MTGGMLACRHLDAKVVGVCQRELRGLDWVDDVQAAALHVYAVLLSDVGFLATSEVNGELFTFLERVSATGSAWVRRAARCQLEKVVEGAGLTLRKRVPRIGKTTVVWAGDLRG